MSEATTARAEKSIADFLSLIGVMMTCNTNGNKL